MEVSMNGGSIPWASFKGALISPRSVYTSFTRKHIRRFECWFEIISFLPVPRKLVVYVRTYILSYEYTCSAGRQGCFIQRQPSLIAVPRSSAAQNSY